MPNQLRMEAQIPNVYIGTPSSHYQLCFQAAVWNLSLDSQFHHHINGYLQLTTNILFFPLLIDWYSAIHHLSAEEQGNQIGRSN